MSIKNVSRKNDERKIKLKILSRLFFSFASDNTEREKNESPCKQATTVNCVISKKKVSFAVQ
jgi:hypothetical protein